MLASALEVAISPPLLLRSRDLFSSAWIVSSLFAAGALFQFACLAPRWTAAAAVALVALLCVLAPGPGGPESAEGLALLARRTTFALFFHACGYVVKSAPGQLRAALASPGAAVLGFAAAEVLSANTGMPAYGLDPGNLHGAAGLARLACTGAIVLLLFSLSHFAARMVAEGSALLATGRAFLPILIAHPAVFLAVNAALIGAGLLPSEALADLGFSPALNQTWLLYFVPAIAVPVLFQRAAALARSARPRSL